MREGGAGFKIKGSESTKKSTKKKARVSHKPKSTILIGQRDSDTGGRKDSMTQEERAEERKGGDKKC